MTTLTAEYTDTGNLTVLWNTNGHTNEVGIGTVDADGGEWIDAVDAMLRAAGYERTGDWDGDHAPVRELGWPTEHKLETLARVRELLADIPGTVAPGQAVTVSLNIVEGHEGWDEQAHTQAVTLGIVTEDGDGNTQDRHEERFRLPVDPAAGANDYDGDVFQPAYNTIVEAIDEWLTARGLPWLDPAGGLRVETPAIAAERWAA